MIKVARPVIIYGAFVRLPLNGEIQQFIVREDRQSAAYRVDRACMDQLQGRRWLW